VVCPECWLNEKSIVLRHILTSVASRLEFVTMRNHMANLRLWDVTLTLRTVLWLLCSRTTYIYYSGMNATTVVPWKWPLCSINRHNTVCSWPATQATSCVVSQVGKYIYFKTNQNKVLSYSEFDTENGHSSLSRFCGKWQNREKHKRTLGKYANYKGQQENFWMWW
jgi:hypothetical protein